MFGDEVLERFTRHSPITVMAHLGLLHAFDAAWLDALFDATCEMQYTRTLLFSTIVQVMALVTFGIRPSLHAAAKRLATLPVSLQALYEKVKKTEPRMVRAMLQGSVARLAPVITAMGPRPPLVPGYQVRIVDGNHLPPSEKRLNVLRAVPGAALPGQTLVVYDPALGLVVDLVPWENAHTSERVLMEQVLPTMHPGELWLADRQFCTRAILGGIRAHGAHFLIRAHAANAPVVACTPVTAAGVIDTGRVYEQEVALVEATGPGPRLRQIELHLTTPTTAGATIIRLLSNVPRADLSAAHLAQLYRQRWGIEHLFQRVEAALEGEIRTLGHPRAALLAFGLAVVAYNVLALVHATVTVQHASVLTPAKRTLSAYSLALEIQEHYRGMQIAVPVETWQPYRGLSATQLAHVLLTLATAVDPRVFSSHPSKPKKKKPPRRSTAAERQRHVATAELLAAAKHRKS